MKAPLIHPFKSIVFIPLLIVKNTFSYLLVKDF
nr:MAG TPA: hypothetical protein [Caudoviricetes sp.]